MWRTPGYPPLPAAILRLCRLYAACDEDEICAALHQWAREGIRTTVFVTGAFMERKGERCVALAKAGCELGLHGYRHLSPGRIAPHRFEADLASCVRAFKRRGIHASGYRAPHLSFPASLYPVLRRMGIRYSSSRLCQHDRAEPMEQCISFMDVPMLLHLPSENAVLDALRQHFAEGKILCLHPYGLLGRRRHLVRRLLVDSGLRAVTIAEKLDGGKGMCISVDFGF
ncbi:MAG: polysaccharide deacetylase family protein [bacterium]|nr:polysaccharide deacetylase family protein [bacterium]